MDALVSQYEGDGKETLQSISDDTIDKVFKGKVILAYILYDIDHMISPSRLDSFGRSKLDP